MAKNALILHGTQGNSKENWFPWLKNLLEEKGYEVWLPDLPDSNVPNLKKYLEFIKSNGQFEIGPETLLVGHSSGAVTCLAVLDNLPEGIKIDKCIMVAPFEKDSPGGKWDANRELFIYRHDINKVKTKANKFVLLISRNDPYCPVEYVKKLGKKLDGEVVVTESDGHFSVSSGGDKYKKLPLLQNFL